MRPIPSRISAGNLLLIAALLFGGGALTLIPGLWNAQLPKLEAPSSDEAHLAAAATPETFIVNAIWPFDFSDERVLMGVSSHAFLGRVIEQVGTEGIPIDNVDEEIPQTQFAVEVLEVVKGGLPNTVTVNQSSGINKTTGNLELVEGDPLLKPGEIVFFVTWYDPETGFYDIGGASHGAVRVENAAEQTTVIARFTEAALNEFDPDEALRSAAENADSGTQIRAERDRNERDRNDRKRDRQDRNKRGR